MPIGWPWGEKGPGAVGTSLMAQDTALSADRGDLPPERPASGARYQEMRR
jgi:hypothetical protein